MVTVAINGGSAFPQITGAYRVGYRPGLTIGDALAGSGAVGVGAGGQIVAVGGIPIGSGIGYQLRYNGRVIPGTMLQFPVQPADTISLELTYG